MARCVQRGTHRVPRSCLTTRLLPRLLLILSSTCALEVAIARADDVVTQPYEGVRHIKRTTATPNRIHIIEVDLTNPRVRMRATRPGDRGQVVSAWAAETGCQVAINGDFFAFDGYSTSGLAIGHGTVWSDSAVDTVDHGVLAFGVDNRALLARPGVVTPVEDWMSDVVSGHPVLVRDGQRFDYPTCTGLCVRNPRTAVGLSQDEKTLWMVTVDGRSSTSVGASLNELGGLMKSLGAHTAINLDGGGSTTMYVKNQGGVVNSPSDGAQRVVANHLGVCIVPPFGTLKGYVREGDIQDETAGLAGMTVLLSTGASAVTDADGYYEIAEVPRGDVTIAVDGDGYVATERDVYVTAGDPTWGSVALVPGEDPSPDDGGGGDDGEVGGTGDAGVAGAAGDDMVTGSCAVGANSGGSFDVLVLLLLLVVWKVRAPNRRSPDRIPRPRGRSCSRAEGRRAGHGAGGARLPG